MAASKGVGQGGNGRGGQGKCGRKGGRLHNGKGLQNRTAPKK